MCLPLVSSLFKQCPVRSPKICIHHVKMKCHFLYEEVSLQEEILFLTGSLIIFYTHLNRCSISESGNVSGSSKSTYLKVPMPWSLWSLLPHLTAEPRAPSFSRNIFCSSCIAFCWSSFLSVITFPSSYLS